MNYSTAMRPEAELSERWLTKTKALYLPFWTLIVLTTLAWGWSIRNEGYLTAENGIGYWLGITGGSMMLLLLTYSLRKRLKSLKRFFTVKFWFRFHMILGIVGPMFIIFHSNFHLGSLNSSIALTCMLLVSGSGLVGRYLYGNIHYGLYGEKIRLQDIQKDFELIRNDISSFTLSEKQDALLGQIFVEINSLINSFKEKKTILSSRSARHRANKISSKLKACFQQLEKSPSQPDTNLDELHHKLDLYMNVLVAVLKKLPRLSFTERLFSLWHVVHLPIFGLMVITAITHIVVVHMY